MKSRRVAGVLLVASLAAACSDSILEPVGEPARSVGEAGLETASSERRERPRFVGVEQVFAEIAAEAPSFAGFFRDEDGGLVVQVADERDAPRARVAAERALAARGGGGAAAADAARERGRGAAQAATRSRRVAHSFLQLADFRDAFREHMPAGVYSLDVDEVRNVVNVGIASPNLEGTVRAAAARAGIPPSALRTYVAPAPELRNLSGHHRPVRGGARHTWYSPTYCSVGINAAYYYTTTYAGYITASHCSFRYMGLDNSTTYYHQPTIAPWNLFRVGYEFHDPVAFTGGSCAPGRACRWSDAMFVRYLPDRASAANGFNTIFRTDFWGYGGRGSTNVNGHMTINGYWYGYVGDMLDKVGATSGWTYGFISETCVDKFSGVYDSAWREIWVLCNDVSNIWSEGGDSGSPVFRWNGDTVQWAGILWGGPGSNYNETWHSPWHSVDWELWPYWYYF